MEFVKKFGMFLALVLLTTPVLSVEWGDWEWKCEYGDDEASSNFLIYFNSTKYYSKGGFIEVFVKPNIHNSDFLETFSEIRISDSKRPLIPAFHFPSTDFLSETYRNGSFFIPFQSDTVSEPIDIIIAANSSNYELKCSTVSWTPLGEITDDLSGTEGFYPGVEFDPDTSRFNFTAEISPVTGLEKLSIYLVVLDTETQEVLEVVTLDVNRPSSSSRNTSTWLSNNQYNSYEVSTGKYITYVFAFDLISENPVSVYFEEFPTFEFRDFDISIRTIPNLVQGTPLELHFTLKNVGTSPDNYNCTAHAPDLWGFAIQPVENLNVGEEDQIVIKLQLPESVIGVHDVILTVESLDTGLLKNYTVTVSPEKTIDLDVTITAPLVIVAYDSNPINLTFLFEATIEPEIFWTIYTEPALLLSGGHDSLDLIVGGSINRAFSTFNLGGSCAFNSINSEAFNSGRKVLLLSSLAYDLTFDISDETLEQFERLLTIIDAEKLSMASTYGTRLFSRTEKLMSIIENIVIAHEFEYSDSRKNALREDLYLFSIDFGNELRSVGERMAEDCTAVSEVEFFVYVFSKDTLEAWIKSKPVEIEGSTMIELIGPSEVKAISGDTTIVEYIVKNSAGERFEIDLESSTDIISLIPYFYLEAGDSKKIDFKFRPPEYYEVQNEKIFIEISTRSHVVNFPILLSVGNFNPELELDDLAIIPGMDASETFIIDTKGIDDTFEIATDCPSWVSLPETTTTFNGIGNFTVLMMPDPNTKEKSYDCELTFISHHFPDYRVRDGFLISVSAEALTLNARMQNFEDWYDEISADIPRMEKIKLEELFDKANRDIIQGEYIAAKVTLNKIENSLMNAEEEEPEGVSPLVFVIVGVLAVMGFVIWKFVLVKKPKLSQDDMDMGAGGGEII